MKKKIITTGFLLAAMLTANATNEVVASIADSSDDETPAKASPSAITTKTNDDTIIIPIGTEYYGDTNEDKVVDISDVVSIVNYILNGGTTSGTFEALNADINKDKNVDISDVVGVVNLVLNGEKMIRVSEGNAAEAHVKPINNDIEN